MLSNRDAELARQRSLARFLQHLADRQMEADIKRAMLKTARLAIARNRTDGLLATLEGTFRLLPLETCLALFPLLSGMEQLALQSILFGKIVTWQTAVRRGRVPESAIQNMQRLIGEHVEAAHKAKSRK